MEIVRNLGSVYQERKMSKYTFPRERGVTFCSYIMKWSTRIIRWFWSKPIPNGLPLACYLLIPIFMGFFVFKFINIFVYSWAGSISSMALSLESSNQTWNQDKEVWTFGLCRSAAWMWLAVSSPSALGLRVCTLEWQAFLCEESQHEDIFVRTTSAQAGIQGTETPAD